MYRGDAARSGYTAQDLPAKLHLHWQYKTSSAPSPAWPNLSRMSFDRAYQLVVAEGKVYFGSSTDGHIQALDARSGKCLWTYHTNAPVRFAPVAGDGRIYAGSDDGFLYCLDSKHGRVLWSLRGGPEDYRVLGNGRMISRWPVRGGPVLRDGVLYFAAGIWPAQGIYVHAVDAKTGKQIWLNSDSGDIYMPQPHGGANARSGVSVQGHLVATNELLLVPNGRAVPAAFDLKSGAFRYFHLQKNGHTGGTATMASGKFFFNNGVFFDAKTGASQGKTGGTAIAGLPDGVVTAGSQKMDVFRWTLVREKTKDGKQKTVRKLERSFGVPRISADSAVIVAGSRIVLGGKSLISLIGLREKRETWSTKVEGRVHGLAVARGRLYATTDAGSIYCFGPKKLRPQIVLAGKAGKDAKPSAIDKLYLDAADEILAKSGVSEGYCLDLGCGDGALTQALLEKSRLQIVAVDQDPANVARARARLQAAGLYGTRVMVQQAPEEAAAWPPYFASLVVSARSLTEGLGVVDVRAAARVQRPHGGVQILGRPGAMSKTVRGALAWEGTWTHQYADPANSSCSGDGVRGPLGILWFTEHSQGLTQRHGRGPAPLYLEGRVYSLGLDSLVAVDAYTGRLLWQYPFPGILRAFNGDHLMGTSGSHSPYCVSPTGVHVRQGQVCLRLDLKTGKKLGEFKAPSGKDGKPAPWGYLALEGGLLYGSLANPEHVVTFRYVKGGDLSQQLTESSTLFALDAKSGKLEWRYDSEHSIRHNAIAIGGGRVYLIDRPLAVMDRYKKKPKDVKLPPHAPGILLALNSYTGKKAWEISEDIFGTLLALSVKHNALLMSYQPTRFRLDSEVGGRLAVYDLDSGQRLWQQKARYDSRPMIIGEKIYAQGGAWDLRSGTSQPFPFSRSYGCGILASGENLLVYRSATLGYYDLQAGQGNENFGGIRPGCWINAIPAGGMVIVPDGSTGCRCSYQNKAWVALRPDDLRRPTALPKGGAFAKPQQVLMKVEDAKTKIRYTLDGSQPTANSRLYSGPIRVSKDTTIKAQSFKQGVEPSRVATFDYVVDPRLLPLDAKSWRVWDVPGKLSRGKVSGGKVSGGKVSGGPSQWKVEGAMVSQLSNIFLAPKKKNAKDQPYYGTLYIYQAGKSLRNGEFSVQVLSQDNDGLGLAFRLQDPTHHYLFHMDRERRFRVLARRDGDKYKVLAKDAVAYPQNRWMKVSIKLDGPRITVTVDGKKVFQVTDNKFKQGTVALHTWGSQGVKFKNIRF